MSPPTGPDLGTTRTSRGRWLFTRLGVSLVVVMLLAWGSGATMRQGPDRMIARAPACPSFTEVARLPSDIETAGFDPQHLLWFEAGGRLRLGIRALNHVDIWDVGAYRPQLAYRVPATTGSQPVIAGDGGFLLVNRGRRPLVDSRNRLTPTGSDTHVIDAATGTELRVMPSRNPALAVALSDPFPLPGTTLVAGISDGALVVADAANGRFVAMRDFAQDPLPPGRMASRPNEPQPRPPYDDGGTAAASQGGALLALTTRIAQQVTLPDGRFGWVRTRAVDVWTLDGASLRLLRTIPLGGFADQTPALLAMERDGRHALVAMEEVQFVNEVSGVSHLYFPPTAPPRLLRVDLVAGSVVAQTAGMLPRSRDGRPAKLVDLALDPQGRFVALPYGTGVRGGPDGVLFFNPVTLAPICNLDFSRQWVGKLAISADGTLLALAVNYEVRVLRIPTFPQGSPR